MKIKIVSKNFGSQVIDTENFCAGYASSSSTVFKVVEHMFNEWYDSAVEGNREIRAMYFGDGDEPACYCVKGAIRGGIETLIEICEESGKDWIQVTTRDIAKMDIECAFQ